MRPTREEIMAHLADAHGDRAIADYIEQVLDRVEASGGVIAETRPPQVAAREATGAPATGTRAEIDWLQVNTISIGERCADNASRITDVEAVARQYGDELTETFVRISKLEKRPEATRARRGDRLWHWLRRRAGR